VLLELRVRNLLLIESAELALDRGLNALTGETGAGKTMLAQALDLLLGGKPRSGIVRPGTSEAWVEGCFDFDPALREDPELSGFGGRVSDSGEGRWTSMAAIDEGVPAHVLAAALFERFSSRGEADFADKLLSAMRKQFGGHDEKPPAGA